MKNGHRILPAIYVYFYQQALRLTHAGGRLSFIVPNKWMRAGYGEPLRAFFAEQGALEQMIDFGHAPIFEDADVFPCILILEKPGSPEQLKKLVEAIKGVMDPLGQQIIAATKKALSTAPPEDQEQRMKEAGVNVLKAAHPTMQQRLAEAAASVRKPVQVLHFPREQVDLVNLGHYFREQSQSLPQSHFGRAPWKLES